MFFWLDKDRNMSITPLKKIKSDDRGVIYDCDKVGFIVRQKGSISANHSHSMAETLYLVCGQVELTIGDKVQKVIAPAKIDIKGGDFHKLVALTDIMIIEDKFEFGK